MAVNKVASSTSQRGPARTVPVGEMMQEPPRETKSLLVSLVWEVGGGPEVSWEGRARMWLFGASAGPSFGVWRASLSAGVGRRWGGDVPSVGVFSAVVGLDDELGLGAGHVIS